MISDNQNTPIHVDPLSSITISPTPGPAESREPVEQETRRPEPAEPREEATSEARVTTQQEPERQPRQTEPEHREPVPESSSDAPESAPEAKLTGGGVAAMPVVVLDTSGPQAVNVGQPAEFRLAVSNLGDTLAEKVVVEFVVPENSELKRSNPTAETVGDRRFRFPVTDLEAGAKQQFVVVLVPLEGGLLDLTAGVTFTTTTHCGARVCQPQLQLEYRGPAEADLERPTPFKLVVANTGDGPAANVCVRRVAANGEAESSSSELPTIELLAAGETRELATSIVPDRSGVLELNYVATGEGDLEAECEASLQVRCPRLEVELRGPKTTYVRRGAVFGVVVTNAGDVDATDACVAIVLPPGLRVTETDPSVEFDGGRNVLRWNLPVLASGEEKTVAFRANAEQEGEQVIDVTAQAASGGSAEVRHATQVVSRPDLSLELDYNDGQIEVDDIEDFLILVKNRGTCAANGVTVKASLPAGLEVMESPDYSSTKDDLSFNPFSLAAGTERTLTFKVRGRTPGDHVIRVYLSDETVSRETVREENIFCFEG